MQKKNFRSVLIIILIIALLASTVAGYFFMKLQPQATVSDRTTDPTVPSSGPDGSSATDPGDTQPDDPIDPDAPGTDEVLENVAVLSQNVSSFTEDTGKQINEAILSLEPLSEGVQMRIATGTAFDSLGIGDVFFLEGSEQTPFGTTYIGKIASVITEDGVSSYFLETPSIEEVFDQLSFTYDSVLTEDSIEKVECLDGISCSLNQPLSSDDGSSPVKPLVTIEDQLKKPLMFEIEGTLDLLEAFGIKKDESKYEGCEEVDREQAAHVVV